MPTTEKPKGKYLTFRKKKLAKLILENPGKPDGKLMTEAGYAPGYAKNPQELKQTASWGRIMSRVVSEEHIGKRHREALDWTNEVETIGRNGRKYKKRVPDGNIRLRAVELGYKVHGRLRDNTFGENSGSEEIEAIVLRVKRMFPESR